jgi:hypothetical protein
MKRFAQNCILLLVACILSLILVETGSRLVINQADYLSVATVPDEILGIVIKAKSPGFDEWGFRNTNVPSKADFVAIGDSHTFGNGARMDDSWPMVLGRLSMQSVYNLGMGGYGPNQYYHLLKTKALILKPRLVLCGLYMGDDFENAYSITYGLEHWSFLRQGQREAVNADIWDARVDTHQGFLKGFRNWLSQNSILYQLVFHGQIRIKIRDFVRAMNLFTAPDPHTTYLIVEDHKIHEAFRPIAMRNRLDQTSSSVQEGMRITLELLKDMNEICRLNGSQFLVVMIPTKEMVFSEFLEKNPNIQLNKVIDELLLNERIASSELIKFFRESGIRYVDTLPALKREAPGGLYNKSDKDMHPNKNGYKVIGEEVYRSLNGFGTAN